jgi:ATP-dependent Lhr-like helicase
VYWMNAADPASLCGSGLEALKGVLPARMPATHIVFHGARPVLVSRRQARELEFRVPPEEVRIPDYLAFVSNLVNRDARPLSAVHVETINGEPAGSSPYKGLLISFGFKEDFKRLTYRGGPR